MLLALFVVNSTKRLSKNYVLHQHSTSLGQRFNLISPPSLEHAVLKKRLSSSQAVNQEWQTLREIWGLLSLWKWWQRKQCLGKTGSWVHFKMPTNTTPSTIHFPFTVLVVLECFSSEGGYLLSSSPCMTVCLRVKEREVKLRKAFIYRYLKAAGPWNPGMYYDVPLEKQKQNPLLPVSAIFITYVSSQLYSIKAVFSPHPLTHHTLLVQSLFSVTLLAFSEPMQVSSECLFARNLCPSWQLLKHEALKGITPAFSAACFYCH